MFLTLCVVPLPITGEIYVSNTPSASSNVVFYTTYPTPENFRWPPAPFTCMVLLCPFRNTGPSKLIFSDNKLPPTIIALLVEALTVSVLYHPLSYGPCFYSTPYTLVVFLTSMFPTINSSAFCCAYYCYVASLRAPYSALLSPYSPPLERNLPATRWPATSGLSFSS